MISEKPACLQVYFAEKEGTYPLDTICNSATSSISHTLFLPYFAAAKYDVEILEKLDCLRCWCA